MNTSDLLEQLLRGRGGQASASQPGTANGQGGQGGLGDLLGGLLVAVAVGPAQVGWVACSVASVDSVVWVACSAAVAGPAPDRANMRHSLRWA